MEMPEREQASLSAEDCRDQLERILASADFHATDRERRFLSYVVLETLAGRADRIKAYSIAVEVFEREASFDPQTDPAVRIAAGRLRNALERYYLTAGQADPILIDMPKGGYVASFSPRSPSDSAGERPADITASVSPWSRLPSRLWLIGVAALLVVAALALGFWTYSSPRFSANKPAVPHLLVEWFDHANGSKQTGLSPAGSPRRS